MSLCRLLFLPAVAAMAFGPDVLAAAWAGTLPRHPEPAAAVDACRMLGPGYHQVAGTSTCVRVSGSVRFETTLASGGSADRSAGVGAFVAAPRR